MKKENNETIITPTPEAEKAERIMADMVACIFVDENGNFRRFKFWMMVFYLTFTLPFACAGFCFRWFFDWLKNLFSRLKNK
jgi:hypothetical protein